MESKQNYELTIKVKVNVEVEANKKFNQKDLKAEANRLLDSLGIEIPVLGVTHHHEVMSVKKI